MTLSDVAAAKGRICKPAELTTKRGVETRDEGEASTLLLRAATRQPSYDFSPFVVTQCTVNTA